MSLQDPTKIVEKPSHRPFERMVAEVVHSGNPRVATSLKQAIWLYLSLLLQASYQGTVELNVTATAQAIGTQEATISTWLGHLRKAGLVSIKKWPGSLVVKLTRYPAPLKQSAPGQTPNTVHKKEDPSQPRLSDVDRAFARTLSQTLQDEANLPHYEELVSEHGQITLTRMLKQAQAVPAEKIRKSRAALFHFILRNRGNKGDFPV